MEVTRWVRSTFRYVFQYKNRIALASIFAIVLAIVVAYYENWDPWTIFGFDRRKNNRVCSDPQTQSNSMPTKFRTSAVNGSRSRILLRIRRQYDNSCHHFIPTLRRKILDTVDISATVRKLKELRATAGINISGSAEQELWDEIKISSLSLFFVAIYMVSALCTLLRVQLHVLARTLIHMEQQDSRLHAQEEDFGLDSQMFRALIDGTYRHLFSVGLPILDEEVRYLVRKEFSDWQVKTKDQVTYDDLHQRLLNVRYQLDIKLDVLISKLFIPLGEMSGSEGSGMNILPSPGGLSANSSGAVLKLLYQTWDILESEGYQIVFTEAVDTSFNFVMQQLRTQVFFPTNLILESGEGGRAPPLVSLLPQIKSVVSEILSDDLDNKVAAHHKTLAVGPLLDSLCVAILDAVERGH